MFLEITNDLPFLSQGDLPWSTWRLLGPNVSSRLVELDNANHTPTIEVKQFCNLGIVLPIGLQFQNQFPGFL